MCVIISDFILNIVLILSFSLQSFYECFIVLFWFNTFMITSVSFIIIRCYLLLPDFMSTAFIVSKLGDINHIKTTEDDFYI